MGNIILSSILIISSVFFFMVTFSFQDTGAEAIGVAFWPRLISILIIILSLVTIIQSVKEILRHGFQPEESYSVLTMIVGAIILFYLLVIPYLGYLITSLLSVGALMYALGEKNKYHLILLTFAMVGIVYFLFVKILTVPLPRGVGIIRDFSKLFY